MPRAVSVFVVCLVLAVPVVSAQAPQVPPRPTPARLVNDFGGLLSPAEADALERKLVAFDDSTGTQIAVVTLPSLGGQDESLLATEIGQQWGVGQANFDNGVVLLVAVQDRRIAIATGYGVEGLIPDVIAGRIIREVITPAFRGGQFFAGLDRATDALIAATRGEFVAPPSASGDPSEGFWLVFGFLLVIFVLMTIARAGSGGGGRGGRGRGPGIIVLPGGSWGGGGGGFGGGFGGGGGGFGGGFGGFGGGGFGGGGASGGW